MDKPPMIENAPGLVWVRLVKGWVARWQARRDLIQRGFEPQTVRLWAGSKDQDEPSEIERKWISDRCNALQSEMLVWGRGGLPVLADFDDTLKGLIECYQSDPDSTYRKLRYRPRMNYNGMLRRLIEQHGAVVLENINARVVNQWHREWSVKGVVMAHSLVAMLRILFGFGATILEDEQCERLCGILHKMRFEQGKPRKERLTADHATAVRMKAHEKGYPSLALAQAFQFEGTMRQKDVIGEIVPQNEDGVSDVLIGNGKWLRGIRWSEIDDKLILTHMTSKKEKDIVVNLCLAPMVIEELNLLYPGIAVLDEATQNWVIDRSLAPTSGPVIIFEDTTVPYYDFQFRHLWRDIARAAGVPDKVYNMDSRAGAISEGTASGAELNDVRHAAAHSDIAMTQRYDRIQAEATEKVMRLRAAQRNKK